MYVFSRFFPSDLSPAHLESLFSKSERHFGETLPIIRVCLGEGQDSLRTTLEGQGFRLDGVVYQLVIDDLRKSLPDARRILPPGYHLRAMNFEQDIDQVVALEKSVHAADESSRVNFDTDAAVQGMKGYYKRIASAGSAFVLGAEEKIVGLVGFMPDKEHSDSVHISSIALSLALQGKGLFFSLILNALELSAYASFPRLTGVTTTTRLLQAAKKYNAKVLGQTLSRIS